MSFKRKIKRTKLFAQLDSVKGLVKLFRKLGYSANAARIGALRALRNEIEEKANESV